MIKKLGAPHYLNVYMGIYKQVFSSYYLPSNKASELKALVDMKKVIPDDIDFTDVIKFYIENYNEMFFPAKYNVPKIFGLRLRLNEIIQIRWR